MVSSLAFHDIAPFLRFMTSMRVGGGGGTPVCTGVIF